MLKTTLLLNGSFLPRESQVPPSFPDSPSFYIHGQTPFGVTLSNIFDEARKMSHGLFFPGRYTFRPTKDRP